MTKKKQFLFFNYENWDDELYDAILNFINEFNIDPNIMLSSESTYQKIESIIKNSIVMRKNVFYEKQGNHEKETKFELSGFKYDDKNIEFCLDNSLKENSFSLIYDDDIEFINYENYTIFFTTPSIINK